MPTLSYPTWIRFVDPELAGRFPQLSIILKHLTGNDEKIIPAIINEAIESLFLLATNNPSLDTWLKIQNPQGYEIVDLHLIQQFLQQMYQWPMNVVTLESPNGDKLPICGLVGYLNPHLDSSGHIQLVLVDQNLLSVPVTVESEFEGKKLRFDATLRFPQYYEEPDITQLLCSFCAIPVRIISLVLEHQQDKLPEDWKGTALRILTVLEEGATSQRTLLTTADLWTIIEKAKLGLDDDSSFLSAGSRDTRNAITELLKQQVGVHGIVDVFQHSFGPMPNHLHFIIPDPQEAFSQASQNACAFMIAVLHCLHYASLTGAGVIKDLQVSLSLQQISETRSHDIGLSLALHISREGELAISIPPSSAGLGEKIPITLYTSIEADFPAPQGLHFIPKYPLSRANLSKVIGVRYGNLYSSLAIVSVGVLPGDISSYWADRVAALIELDARRGYVAGIPDPWPYNVRKISQVIATNPNIRTVLFVGDTSFCRDTLSLLSQRAVPTTRELPALTRLLLARYAQQIVWTATFDDLSLKAPLSQNYSKVISLAYLNNTEGIGILGDMPAFAETFSLPEAPIPKLTPLPWIDPHFATVNTLLEAHYAILYALMQFGKPALPDELGYHSIELTNYTVEVMDLTRDKMSFGSTFADLERHYQIEWINPEGRHGKRLMYQFGSNQLDELAKRIAERVRNRQTSRRLIIYMADPYRDRSSPLGLMLIHFNIRDSLPEPVFLDATYVWRSFEGLFGPGYSWYGAYRLMEDVVKKCNNFLANQNQLISVGRFNCIMLNLHLFDDDLSKSLTAEFMTAMMGETRKE